MSPDDMSDAPQERPNRGERIAKWLSRAGIASRRDAEALLTANRVRLNGVAVTHPATFIQPGDIVQVDGAVVDAPDRQRLWRYHKPDGLVTTHKDPAGRPHRVRAPAPPSAPRGQRRPARPQQRRACCCSPTMAALSRRLELPANGWIRR